MSSIVTNWLSNIFWFIILYGAYKMYRKYKARPPKHSWDSNWEKWIWINDKPVHRASWIEEHDQMTWGRPVRSNKYCESEKYK